MGARYSIYELQQQIKDQFGSMADAFESVGLDYLYSQTPTALLYKNKIVRTEALRSLLWAYNLILSTNYKFEDMEEIKGKPLAHMPSIKEVIYEQSININYVRQMSKDFNEKLETLSNENAFLKKQANICKKLLDEKQGFNAQGTQTKQFTSTEELHKFITDVEFIQILSIKTDETSYFIHTLEYTTWRRD